MSRGYIPIGARRFWKPYWYVKVGEGEWKLEHRIMMEDLLHRPLQSDEHVHHINEIKTDNRPENFELHTKASHMSEHNRRRTGKPRKGAILNCTVCNSEVTYYRGVGLCTRCYASKRRGLLGREAINRWKREWYAKNSKRLKDERQQWRDNNRDSLNQYFRERYKRQHPGAMSKRRDPGAWSANHPACIECGKTDRGYGGHGLCKRCYGRRREHWLYHLRKVSREVDTSE